MDQRLRTFLLSRSIPDETINSLESENVDVDVINTMSKDQLAHFFPKLGDQLAIIDFCQKFHFKDSKKQSLLDRLRVKISSSKTSKDGQTSTSCAGKSSCPPNTKPNRQIELGWLLERDDGVLRQVRTKLGGGTRKITVSKDYKKEEILKISVDLFFPKGMNCRGKISDFESINLLDFQQKKIDDSLTVGDMYALTGLPTLRFYLATKQKEKQSSNLLIKGSEPDPNYVTIELPSHNIEADDDKDTKEPSQPNSPSYDLETETVYDFEYLNTLFPQTDLFLNNLPTPENIAGSTSSALQSSNVTNKLSESTSMTIPMTEIGDDTILLTIHRGQEFKEMLAAFCNFPVEIYKKIELKMILPNGEEEKGVDVGGIWRDCLTEFWAQFYEMCTEGTNVKVPCIRHDFQEKEWTAIARILKKGWECEKYFPILLSPSFVEYTFFGSTPSTLKHDFINQISGDDADVLNKCLAIFPQDEDEFDELLGILDTFGCKIQPSVDTIENLIEELAHKEIIQRPQFIIGCWRPVVQGLFDEGTYRKFMEDARPTAKNILKGLVSSTDLSMDTEKKTTFDFLKKYLKETDNKNRSLFLRFCTGSNIVNKTIIVDFKKSHALSRSPIGHVCGCCLELPYPYENYQEFRKDFNMVLASNIWVMDIA